MIFLQCSYLSLQMYVSIISHWIQKTQQIVITDSMMIPGKCKVIMFIENYCNDVHLEWDYEKSN